MFCVISPVAQSPAWSVEGQYIQILLEFEWCPVKYVVFTNWVLSCQKNHIIFSSGIPILDFD